MLTISENTGVVDVAIDPVESGHSRDAAAYQRRRHVFTFDRWRTGERDL